jgi:hypothetical protein
LRSLTDIQAGGLRVRMRCCPSPLVPSGFRRVLPRCPSPAELASGSLGNAPGSTDSRSSPPSVCHSSMTVIYFVARRTGHDPLGSSGSLAQGLLSSALLRVEQNSQRLRQCHFGIREKLSGFQCVIDAYHKAQNSAPSLTFPCTGPTSAYPSRYRRPLVLGPSFSSVAYGWLSTLTRATEGCPVPAEGVSIGRDRRVTLDAGLPFEWRGVRLGDTAAQPVPVWACRSAIGQVLLDDAYVSLLALCIVTGSGRQPHPA